jgi:hypothetical protein
VKISAEALCALNISFLGSPSIPVILCKISRNLYKVLFLRNHHFLMVDVWYEIQRLLNNHRETLGTPGTSCLILQSMLTLNTGIPYTPS